MARSTIRVHPLLPVWRVSSAIWYHCLRYTSSEIQWSHRSPRYVTKRITWGWKARGGYRGFKPLIYLWKNFMHLPIAPFVSNGWKIFHLNPDCHPFCWWVLCTNCQFFCLRACPPWLLAWAWVQGRRRLKKWLVSNQSIYWQVGSFMQNLSFSTGRRK